MRVSKICGNNKICLILSGGSKFPALFCQLILELFSIETVLQGYTYAEALSNALRGGVSFLEIQEDDEEKR